MKSSWHIRLANDDDRPFLLDSWAKSTRDEPWAGCIPNNMYMAVLQESVRQLVARGMHILIACNPERESQIVGWLAVEKGRDAERVVHMLYCKRAFRRMGIARLLLAQVGLKPDDPFVYTYRTRMSRVFPNAKHLPAVARRHKV